MTFMQVESKENTILIIEELLRRKKYREVEDFERSLIELIPNDMESHLEESDFKDINGLHNGLLLYQLYKKWIESLENDRNSIYRQQTSVKQEYRGLEKKSGNDEETQEEIKRLKKSDENLKEQADLISKKIKKLKSKKKALKQTFDRILLRLGTLEKTFLNNVDYFRVLKNIYVGLECDVPKKARKIFTRLHELDSNDEECIWMLCDFVKNDNVDLAKYLEKIRILNPYSKKCREKLIQLYTQRSKSSDDYFARQIPILKGEIKNIKRRLIMRKQELEREGRLEEAVGVENEIINLDPANIKSRIHLIKTYLGLIADLENKEYEENDRTGKRREKIEFYRNEIRKLEQTIKKLQPSKIDWRLFLVNLYEDNGLNENARMLLEEILVLDPNNISIRVRLIQIYRVNGQIENEILLQEEIRLLEPSNIKCRQALIRIYQERGCTNEVEILIKELDRINTRRKKKGRSVSSEESEKIENFSIDSISKLSGEMLGGDESASSVKPITNGAKMNFFIHRIKCGEITLENFNEELKKLENSDEESEKLPAGYKDILIAFSYVLLGKGRELAIPYIERAKRAKDISPAIRDRLVQIEKIAKMRVLDNQPLVLRCEVAVARLKGNKIKNSQGTDSIDEGPGGIR